MPGLIIEKIQTSNEVTTTMADQTISGSLRVEGNVGIGTEPLPTAQLYIRSSTDQSQVLAENSAGSLVKLTVDSGEATLGTSTGTLLPLSLQTNGISRLSINSAGSVNISESLTIQEALSVTGNVGIGTSTPAQKLDVMGTVRATAFQGNGAALTGVQVPDGSITSVKLANNAVTNPKLADNSVTTLKIVNDAVTLEKLAPAVRPSTLNGVSNPNGDISLVGANAITLTSNNTTKQITIGESHSGLQNNPHNVTATQIGALPVGGGNLNGSLSIPTGQLNFGAQTRQMINLWQTVYGIGVQSGTQYFRSDGNFCWFLRGTHNDSTFNPGAGGSRLMAVNSAGDLILSARTNPSASASGSACRALVDLGNQLVVNFQNDFSQGVRIDGKTEFTGNVGIGTANPAAKLHVAGGETVLQQEGWTAPTFQNGWSNYGSGFNPAGYFKDSLGVVHLRGLVRNTGIGAITQEQPNGVVFTLPEGYRPASRELHASVTGPGWAAPARVDILTDGRVFVTFGHGSWVTLDGITFRVGSSGRFVFVNPVLVDRFVVNQ